MLCELLSWNSLGGGIGGWFAVGVANVFLTPVLLVYWAIVIYVAPCFRSLLETCCCSILSGLCGDACVFTDLAFPSNDTSAGKPGVKWARISEIKLKGKGDETKLSRLFSNIEPGDIAQGQLGDCWLLAALATLAERQHLIMNCFLTTHYNPRGKYALKLYDQKANQFKTIEIDDKIPVDSNNCPLYSNATTNESWVLLLEKGFAKMRGGYKALEGGLPLDAMTTITGFNGERFLIDKKDDKIWHKMRAMHSANCLMSCGSKGEDRTREEGREAVKGSIVGGHAYSILGLYEPMLSTEKVRLLKLRNPWGNFEWKGKWSDSDASWTQYPGVALEIGRPPEADDGIFYIEWNDFCLLFDLVDVLIPSTHVSQLHMNLHENIGSVLGPFVGCILGLGRYCCLCVGLKSLVFQKTSGELKKELDASNKV